MSAEVKQAFHDLKPVCIAVSQKKDKSSVEQLFRLLKPLSNELVQALNEYVLFPLRIILLQSHNTKEDVIISTSDCMQCIFCRIKLEEWPVCLDIMKVLIMSITTTEGGQIDSCKSECVKLSIINTMITLVNITACKLWKNLYDLSNIPFLGHVVSICVSIITKDRNRSLKKSALLLLSSLCYPLYGKDVCKEDQSLFAVMKGDCMVSFLPGILSALTKVIGGDDKVGQVVKCKALDTIAKLLQVTLGDEEICLAKDAGIRSKLDKDLVEDSLLPFKFKRNEEWLSDISFKVGIMIDRISHASDNTNFSVRLSAVNFSHTIIMNCCKTSLKENITPLLKIPIKLLHDEHKEISTHCQQVLHDFSSLMQENQTIVDVVQDQLLDLCASLPRTLQKSSDEEKLSHLKLLLGYIEVSKAKIDNILYSSPHVKGLIKALLFSFEMDYSDLHKIEEVTPDAANYDTTNSCFFKGQSANELFRKSFVHFRNNRICKKLKQICRLLGGYGDVNILIDPLMESYESERSCRQAVVVINEILMGSKEGMETSGLSNIIENLLDVFISPENWYLCTYHDSVYKNTHHVARVKHNATTITQLSKKSDSGINLKSINANVILACLHLESIATSAIVLGRSFRGKLIKVLYPVLEKVNDSNHLISNCAVETLKTISMYCIYDNVAELINENADYLVSTISVHLRHLDLFPRSPAVLQAMLTHSNKSVFPLVRDTIDEVLGVLDLHRHESPHLTALLPVLLSTVKAINSWFNMEESQLEKSNNDGMTARSSPQTRNEIVQDIKDFIVAYHQNTEIASMQQFDGLDKTATSHNDKLDDETDVNDEYDNSSLIEEATKEDEKKPPPEVKIVEQILSRFCHLLANDSPKVRIIVMDVITEGIKLVSKHEDTLLPLIHKLWNPVIMRCADIELQVVAKAFGVICCMGESSGTFIRQRFTKDSLPKLLTFLSDNSIPHSSSSRNLLIAHKHSTLFKLQRTVLCNLGSLLLHSEVSFTDVHATCFACYHYLSSNQPQELQNSAVILFTHLIKIDCDSLWLFLNDIYTKSSSISPPNSMFRLKSVCLAGSTESNNEFSKNVGYLTTLC